VFEFELGMLLNSAGIKTKDIFAVKNEEEYEKLSRRMMKWWDKEKKRAPIFSDWTAFEHPQFGPVEIGGLLRKYMAGPTLSDLKKISQGTYKFTLEHVRRHPRVVIEDISTDRVGSEVYRVRARVANRGEFPTHVSNRGRNLRRLKGVRVEFQPADGVKLLSQTGHHSLGHLAAITDGRDLEWFVAVEKETDVLCDLRVLGWTGGNVSATVAKPD